MTKSVKRLILWVLIISCLIVLWELVKAGGPKVREVSYSEFLTQAEAGRIRRVTIMGNEARVISRDGQSCVVIIPERQDALVESLRRQNVEVWLKDVQAKWPYWILNLAPLAVFGTLLYMIMKQLREIRRLVEERKVTLSGPEQADK